jgi:sn-glycerol 3-phosphate transport system substrate-binding protein
MLVFITLLGAVLLAASTTVAQAPAVTPIAPVPQPAGAVKVTFWFGLTGALGNVVQQVVNKYNSSQTSYYIEAVQQPDYDATIQKLNTSLAGGVLPNVVQIYDIGTQRMISGFTI